jgi:hypothetical protein
MHPILLLDGPVQGRERGGLLPRTAEPVSKHPSETQRVTLSQELGEFLIELSIALNRTAMYPHGHPSLDEAANVVIQHLASLLYERPNLSIGIARHQLVIEGVATDARNPVLRSLAERLHQHHIGALVFQRGLGTEEVRAGLMLLAQESERGAVPLGLGNPERLQVGPHLRLYPLTYEQLQLIGTEEEGEEDETRAPRAAQLWIGLARAAMASGEAATDEPIEVARTEPAAVAEAINGHPSAQAYDQVIVGYLLQIADELKSEGSAASAAIRRRMSRLIGALNRGTLRRLIEMGGDQLQREKFLLDATDGLAADAVVDLVRAAGDVTSRGISESMLRILMKLSTVAEAGTGQMRAAADAALREQVRRLITDWSLENPNPEAYGFALAEMARTRRTAVLTLGSHPPEPLRVVQTALEVDGTGPVVLSAVDELLDGGGSTALVNVLEEGAENDTRRAIWQHLTRREKVVVFLSREPVDFDTLDRVLAHTNRVEAANMLLDAVCESESRTTRLGVLQLLERFGPEIAPLAAQRLEDERWYVQRNMLNLLRAINVVPPGVSALNYARHPEPRVRREALQLALQIQEERDRAIGMALTDTDDRIVRVGVRAAQHGVPDTSVALLADRAGNPSLPMDLRVNVVRALRTVRSPLALEALLRVSTHGTNFLGKPRIAPKSPALLAALAVLAERWQMDARAISVLKRAQSAADPEIRAAAGGSA